MASSQRPTVNGTSQRQSLKNGPTFAATFQYTEGNRPQSANRPNSAASQQPQAAGVSSRRRAAQLAGMSAYNASPDLPPPLYVRALYNYEADDPTSLSFRQGDIIQVLTQLESGWWDGVINDVRGWFPSNYCSIIGGGDETSEEAEVEAQAESETTSGSGTEEEYDEGEEDDSADHSQDDDSDLPIEGGTQTQEEAAFWVPQATPDGRLFYFNTLTGDSRMELPLETPTSADETGPRERNNFFVPEQTRPPPELMAGGYQHEEDYDGSASEAEPDQSFLSTRKKSAQASGSSSASGSSDSVDLKSPKNSSRQLQEPLPNVSISQAASIPRIGTSSTSFSVPPHPGLNKNGAPKYFAEDAVTQAMSWSTLVENMRISIEAYRDAIQNQEKAEFVRKAEDISDHLRLLLAAGSGTTDNHSGNPSIISTNKTLYPHFREMMSKFSKLVLSSHIAAADWPGPDSLSKCLQEADGVLHGVYGYVEVARQQKGEDIPHLFPGFIPGTTIGGNWRDNNIDNQPEGDSFVENSDTYLPGPSAVLDANLLRSIEDSKQQLIAYIRRLEDQLHLTEKLVTHERQAEIGDSICLGAGAVIDQFRPWIIQIESIDLSILGNIFQKPSLVDFSTQKQKVYDAIGEVVATCQAVSCPLPDEWAEIRADPLDIRLNNVRSACKLLGTSVSNIGYALQLLVPPPAVGSSLNPAAAASKRDHRMTDGGETYQNNYLRGESNALLERPALADIGQSKSYTLGQEHPLDMVRRPPTKDKARQFFGQVPPSLSNLKVTSVEGLVGEDIPEYLRLDYEREVNYDTKVEPPQVKSGTLNGLVEQLTRHDRPEPTFNTTFLLTYRSFTSAAELFELLVQRFNLQPPAALTRDEYLIWEEHKQKPVRFRVVNILRTWLEHYWMENQDEQSQGLLQRACDFAKSTITSTKIPGVEPLIKVIEQRMKNQDTSAKKLVFTLANNAPAPVLPKNMKKLKFLDIDIMEFARQLTIIESRLYGKIKPNECLDKTWQKKDSVDPAPNVKALILHSNRLTNWVAEMILFHQEVKKRVVVIKHFVGVADKCRALNNFSTLTAIVSALGTAPILRLNRTWQQVNPKTLATLERMRTLIASTKNFGQYREELHAAMPPCIPFLGVYLTDLTFIEDGIASVVKNTELINFTKRTKTAEVIRDIQQYQNVPYLLNPVPELQDWMLENMERAKDVHEMYNRSLAIEPREREEEKIARLLSESGFL